MLSGSRRIVAVLAVALLALSACSRTLDTEKLEEEITKGITDQTGQGVESIDCPDDVEVKEGNEFECAVTADDGTAATVTVTQDDDEGNVTWEITEIEE